MQIPRTTATRSEDETILCEGRNCWQIAVADHVSVLVGAAAYFGILRRAMAAARKRILIIGWDVDGRTPLVGDPPEAGDGRPASLRGFLAALAEERPDLDIRILLWDYPPIYGLEREAWPSVALDLAMPSNVRLHLDASAPVAGSHHQKLVIVDDALAFCGGIDLAIRRWDTAEHPVRHPGRIDPHGESYPPFHDLQVMVDGACARALARLAQDRWRHAGGEAMPPLRVGGDIWPDGIEPDFRNCPVGIARTLQDAESGETVREVETLYGDSIRAAKHVIYIENQYLAREGIARALAEALDANPELEAVLVTSRESHGVLEERTMGARREAFLAHLASCGRAERIRVLYPAVTDDGREVPVTVHAKLTIVDDRFLRIGSSNLNGRSMGLDSECDLAIEARDATDRETIAALRDRLLAVHAGVSAEKFSEARKQGDGVIETLENIRETANGDHQLHPVLPHPELVSLAPEAVLAIGDPDRPIDVEEIVGQASAVPDEPEERSLTLVRVGLGAALVAAVVGAILAWRFTPLAEFLDLSVLIDWIERVEAASWTPPAVIGLYVLLGLAAFPVTVLIAATAMVFGPVWGFVYALGGALASAAVGYGMGRAIGRPFIERLAGRTAKRVNEALARNGIVTVAGVRLLPIAPFLIVNLIAGASRIRFADYLAGTLVGMAPGITIMAALGSSIGSLIKSGDPADIAILIGAAVAWVGFAALMHRLLKRRARASR